MKKTLLTAAMLLVSGIALAATDHYVLRDGNHVQHLKISNVGGEVTVSSDVDFEPSTAEEGQHACSAEVSGEAKFTSDTELLMKAQVTGEKRYCSLKIQLTATGAKIEQSEDCKSFAAGICHFSSEGKELTKVK